MDNNMVHRLAITIILFLCLLGCSGKNLTPLETGDYKLQTVSTVLTIIDWRQTQTFTKEGSGYKELNPILGANPSRKKIDTLIPLSIAGQWLVTWWLPKEYRQNWQLFLVGAEGVAVFNNYHIGVRIDL